MDSSKHKFSKSVYDMELNEELIADSIPLIEGMLDHLPLRVLRVPGGWIYYNIDVTDGGVFVPFVEMESNSGVKEYIK